MASNHQINSIFKDEVSQQLKECHCPGCVWGLRNLCGSHVPYQPWEPWGHLIVVFPFVPYHFWLMTTVFLPRVLKNLMKCVFKKCFWIFKWKGLCKHKWYITLLSNRKIEFVLTLCFFIPFQIAHWSVNRPKWVIILLLWFLTAYYQREVVFDLAHLVWYLMYKNFQNREQ